MSHFLFIAIPDRGHLFPNLAVAGELLRRGHRVTVLTGDTMGEVVAPSGAEFLPYDSRYDKIDILDIINTNGAIMPATLQSDSGRMIEAAEAALGDDVPDLIVGDNATPVAWRALAAKWNRPAMQVVATFASNEHFSYLHAMMQDEHGDVAEVPEELGDVYGAMNEVLRKAGIDEPAETFVLPGSEHNIVYLPREFQFAGDTFDAERFRFVGPSLGERATMGDWTPPADGRPVVLVSLGTVFNQMPEFFQLAAQAFADEPWHVVMTVGEGIDIAELGELPANVEIHHWVPHLKVLEHASVFVTHGGLGSVTESLHTATPMVIVPLTPVDEPTARRIAELNVGRVLRFGTMTVEGLRDVVAEVMDDEAIAEATRALQGPTRAAGGTPRAATELEEFLARSTVAV